MRKSEKGRRGILESQIWYKIIKEFNAFRIKYLLVGASAMAIYGIPRSTLDIDVYIEASSSSLKKLFQVAEKLKLETQQKDILKISHQPDLFSNQWLSFSYKNQNILDVFLADKKEFKRLYKNSKIKKDKTLKVRVASLEDIIEMKKQTARAVDLADIELIKEALRFMKKEKKCRE